MSYSLLDGIPFTIGCILFYTSCSKANFSKPFFQHLLRYGVTSNHLSSILVLFIVLIEVLCAFLLLLAPQYLYSVTIALCLFSIFTLSSLFQKFRGHTHTCSCYGLMLPLSIDESIRFNVVYMISLMIYRVNLMDPQLNLDDDLILLVGIVSIIFVYCTSRSFRRPFFDFSPMKIGRAIPNILKEYFESSQEPYILAFMNPDCEDCIKWLKPLKDFHQAGLKIIVITSKENNKNRIFYKYNLHVIKPLHYFWLVFESPSIFYIKSHVISQKLKIDDSIHTLVS